MTDGQGFISWLIAHGYLTHAQLGEYCKTWRNQKQAKAKGFAMQPTSLTMFVARDFPQQFKAYRAMLRLTGQDRF